MVACVSENETVCRGRDSCTGNVTVGLGSFSKKLDVWSQHAHRLTAAHHDTRPWYCTSAPLRVLSSTVEPYTGKIYVLRTQFSPRV